MSVRTSGSRQGCEPVGATHHRGRLRGADGVTELLPDALPSRPGTAPAQPHSWRAAYGNYRVVARLRLDVGAEPNVKDETWPSFLVGWFRRTRAARVARA